MADFLIFFLYLMPAVASAAFFAVSLIFFRRASKACAAGEADGALARKKRIWLALLIVSSVCLAVTVLGVLWLTVIYIAAIFFM